MKRIAFEVGMVVAVRGWSIVRDLREKIAAEQGPAAGASANRSGHPAAADRDARPSSDDAR